MSEKNFLSCIFVDGLLITLLGLGIIIIPKLTDFSSGIVLSIAFIAYGIYKIIKTILSRSAETAIGLNIIIGIFVTLIGLLLLFVPNINILWLIALIGIYFILESISIISFVSQIKNVYNFWGYKMFTAIFLFLIGLIIILGLPMISFWLVTLLSGIGYVLKGYAKISLYLMNKNF